MTSKTSDPSRVPDTQTGDPTQEEIAARAYQCWQERGGAAGSPEADWQRAEQELRAEGPPGQKAQAKAASGERGGTP